MEAYKIAVNVPAGTERGFMDAVEGSFTPIYPGYDHVYTWWPVTGSWRSLEGSNPHIGRIGEVEVAPEVRIEFAVRAEDLRSAVSRVAEAHPYEEPAIDILPLVPWKDVTGTGGS